MNNSFKKLSLEIESLALAKEADKKALESLKSELVHERVSKKSELQELNDRSEKAQLGNFLIKYFVS